MFIKIFFEGNLLDNDLCRWVKTVLVIEDSLYGGRFCLYSCFHCVLNDLLLSCRCCRQNKYDIVIISRGNNLLSAPPRRNIFNCCYDCPIWRNMTDKMWLFQPAARRNRLETFQYFKRINIFIENGKILVPI